MFRNVIVGVDGRDGGRAAAELAVRLQPERIELACVCPIDEQPLKWLLPDYATQLVDEGRVMLRELEHGLGIEAERTVVLDLSPAHRLQQLAADSGADAIVVGACRHPHAAGRLVLGDVTRAVIDGAPCAVVVARGKQGPAANAAMRIGVAYDGRAESRAALRLAVDLAESSGAELVVRSVVDQLPPYAVGMPAAETVSMWPPQPDPAAWRAIVERMRKEAQAELEDALAEIVVPVQGKVVDGGPADELVALSREVDLIVCGSRGWGTVRSVLLGSISDHLIRHAECPVAVVPRPEPAELAASPTPAGASGRVG